MRKMLLVELFSIERNKTVKEMSHITFGPNMKNLFSLLKDKIEVISGNKETLDLGDKDFIGLLDIKELSEVKALKDMLQMLEVKDNKNTLEEQGVMFLNGLLGNAMNVDPNEFKLQITIRDEE
jgi:hypothetical protein